MNYLAHLFLAQPTADSCFGNLLGDFQKGVQLNTYSESVCKALHNHILVDKFTDNHPLVRMYRQRFSRQRRRFAGIALDVLFDHFLITQWSQFSAQDFEHFCIERYNLLARRRAVMPSKMRSVVGSMVDNRWLSSYHSLDNVSEALNKTASRIRFQHQFYNSIEEIQPFYEELAAAFPSFFHALMKHVAQNGPE